MFTSTKHILTSMILAINMVTIPCFSQSGTVTAGASEKNANGSISWSVGQVFTQTISDVNVSVAEGLQQPYEIHDIVSTFDYLTFDINIWPNPVIDILYVKISTVDDASLNYTISTVDGRSLKSGTLDQLTEIALTDITSGMLILTLQYKNQFLSSYKIIKQ